MTAGGRKPGLGLFAQMSSGLGWLNRNGAVR